MPTAYIWESDSRDRRVFWLILASDQNVADLILGIHCHMLSIHSVLPCTNALLRKIGWLVLDNIWQWIPRSRSATFWSEARISQNTRLSQESDSHIYAVSIPPRSYKSLGWGSDNHVRMVKRRKPVYTTVWQRIMRIDDINEPNASTCEPGKWSWWALVPFFSNNGTAPVI